MQPNVMQLPRPLTTHVMAPTMVTILERHQETADVFTIKLQAPAGYTFQAGQFNMLYHYAVGEAAISCSGDALETGVLTHTIRAVGSVTNALSRLQPGDWLGVRGPYGTPWPIANIRGHHVIIISGGLGIAPLRPVVYHLLQQRQQVGRIIWLHGCRTPKDLVYAQEVQHWVGRSDMEMYVTVDQGDANWWGSVGVVTTLFKRFHLDPLHSLALLCGPEVMMRFAQRELAQRGLSEARTYVSLERNMQCAIGICGHCQLGPNFVCMNGPVFRFDQIKPYFLLPEA